MKMVREVETKRPMFKQRCYLGNVKKDPVRENVDVYSNAMNPFGLKGLLINRQFRTGKLNGRKEENKG